MKTYELIERTDPVFEPTKSWNPIKNSEIFGILEADLGKPVRESHYANKKRNFFFGKLAFDFGDPEFAYEVAYCNDFRKRVSLTVAHGLQVYVCSNSCIFANNKAQARHTYKGVPRIINYIREEIISQAKQLFLEKSYKVRELRNQAIEPNDVKALLFDLVANDHIISANEAKKIFTEWLSPSYPEWTDYLGTKFGLYMSATHIAKSMTHTKSELAIAEFNRRLGVN